jgi:exosortase
VSENELHKKYLLFGLLLVISFLLWRSEILNTFARALTDDQYTHVLIIIPVSAAFIFLERKKLQLSSKNDFIFPGIFLAASFIVFCIMARTTSVTPDIQLSILMIALVVWWIASFMLCFGYEEFRIFIFPICFLFWIVPWPQFLLDALIRMLQQGSASSVDWMFQTAGIPVLRNGVILSIPGLTIEVAKECSSIRSSIILLISSMVLAQLFLRSKWRKALVIILAVPLSVVKNAVRIFTLSMLGIHVNRGFLTGRLHHQGGAVFYAGALVVIFLLVYLLQKQETTPVSAARMATATK